MSLRPRLLHELKFKLIRELNNLKTVVMTLENIELMNYLTNELLTGLALLTNTDIDLINNMFIGLQGRNVGEMDINLNIDNEIVISMGSYDSKIAKIDIPILEKLISRLRTGIGRWTSTNLISNSKLVVDSLVGLSKLTDSIMEAESSIEVDGQIIPSIIFNPKITNETFKTLVSVIVIEFILSMMQVTLSANHRINPKFSLLNTKRIAPRINNNHNISLDIYLRMIMLLKPFQNITNIIKSKVKLYYSYTLNIHDPKTLIIMDTQSLNNLSGYIM